jgi:glycosyltransferase involved in cell wall biosynthesis
MAVVAIMMVRDEEDVIAQVVRHTLAQVDWMIVADNASTDRTRPILAALAAADAQGRLAIVDDPVVAYRQAEKMSALAARAAAEDIDNDTIIVPVDADELWYSPTGRPLRHLLPALPWDVFAAPLFNHLRTALDVDDPDPFLSMVWRQRDPGGLPKVAFRWRRGALIEQGNHGVHLPGQVRHLTETVIALRHFPIRSAEHLIGKARNGAAAYADEGAADLPEDWGVHWRAWGQMLTTGGPQALQAAYRAHWFYDSPVDQGLIRDPAPYLGAAAP